MSSESPIKSAASALPFGPHAVASAADAPKPPAGRFWMAGIAVLAAGALLLWHELGLHVGHAHAQLEAQVRARADQVAGVVAPRLAVARLLQQRADLAALFRRWRQSGDAAAGEALLHVLADVRAVVGADALLLLDDEGRILAAEGQAAQWPSPALQDVARRAIAQQAVQLAPPLSPPQAKARWIELAVPLNVPHAPAPADPSAGGVIVLRFAAGTALDRADGNGSPEERGISTAMIRREGDMIVGAAGQRPLPIATPDLLAARVLRGEWPEGQATEARDFRGERVLGAVRSVPGTDWFVVARRSAAGVRAHAWQRSAWTIAATLVALALIGLLRRRQQALLAAHDHQVRLNEQLRTMNLIQAIADQSGDAIFAKDLDGRYMVCNRAATRLMGCGPGQAHGRTDSELLAQQDAGHIVAMDRAIRADGLERTFEESLTTPEGRRTFLTTKAPLLDDGGRVLGVFGIARDITARIGAEAALRDAVQLVQAVQDSQPDPLAVVDREGRIVAVNAAWHAFAAANGANPEAVGVGADYLAVCRAAAGPQSEGAADVAAGLEDVLAGRRERFDFEYPCHAPGTPRWFHLSASPLRTESGGAIVMHTDITSRHLLTTELDSHRHHLQELVDQRTLQLQQANLALTDSERFIHTVADNQPALLSYWDRDLKCRFANRAWRQWFEPAGCDGADACIAIPESVVPEGPAALWEAMARGESRQVLRELRSHDGRSLHGLASFIPDTIGGDACGFLVLVSDVTELRNAELRLQHLNAELTRSRDRAEAANRAKSAFLANMSHELRTPMNAIVGLTHLVRRDAQDPLVRERLAKVSEAAAQLQAVIDDVLDLSRIEAGRLALQREDFMLDEVIDRCAARASERARRKGLSLDVQRAAAPLALRGDPARLAQALSQLLDNAVKFTERGRITLEVSRLDSAHDSRPVLRFLVRDTGIGVAPERQSALFDPFVQADDSATRRFGGAGLGLALTQRLAMLMEGEVGMRSEPGAGSEFWFSACFDAAASGGAAPLAPDSGAGALLAGDAGADGPAGDWPSIEGLDIAVARRHLANRLDVFKSLLGQLAAKQGDAPASSIVQLVVRGRLPEAAQQAHSLRGGMALLGAVALSRLAEQLERALHEQAPAAQLELAARTLEHEHARVLAAVAAWHRTRPVDNRRVPPPSPEELDRLERKLEAADFAATRLHRELTPALRTHAPAGDAEALEKAIRSFDHAAALAALRTLRRSLPN